MIKLTVNGKIVEATDGEMLLAVLQRLNIDIPALCDHKAVEPYGSCRLCTVEITKKGWDGWKKYVTSCLYPVEEGLIVTTHSADVVELRKNLIDLYLARSPRAKLIQAMAAEYGIDKSSFQEVIDGDDCILCGLCTRICDRMGFFAISAVGRGHGKEIAPPLNQPPPDCVGCLACAEICPTDFIKYEQSADSRTIWGRNFEMISCEETGQGLITKEFAEYLCVKQDIPKEYFTRSDLTHRKEMAKTMGRISNWERE